MRINNQQDIITSGDLQEALDVMLRQDLIPTEALATLISLRESLGEARALISENHFLDYAQEEAGEIVQELTVWPLNHIDWEQAVIELKADYTAIDFDGETYWVAS